MRTVLRRAFSLVQFVRNFQHQRHICGSAVSLRRSAWSSRKSDFNRILGARGLAQVSAWPGATSPALAKLVSLAWFLHMIRRRSARWLRQRTRLYRFIDFVGRWSNIDVFMVSILAASLQFGFLTTVDPEAGIVSFAAVVALTMLATAAFDPRLMWDAAEGELR